MPSRLKLTTIGDRNFLFGGTAAGALGFHGLNHIHAFYNFAEDHMLTIEPRGQGGGNKKLGAIGIGATVRHTQQARHIVAQFKAFVFKGVAIDRFTAGAVAVGKIAPLAHKFRDHPVEFRAFEVEGFTPFADAFFASAEGAEVFSGFGGDISAEFKNNASGAFATDGDVEKYFGVGLFAHGFACPKNCSVFNQMVL